MKEKGSQITFSQAYTTRDMTSKNLYFMFYMQYIYQKFSRRKTKKKHRAEKNKMNWNWNRNNREMRKKTPDWEKNAHNTSNETICERKSKEWKFNRKYFRFFSGAFVVLFRSFVWFTVRWFAFLSYPCPSISLSVYCCWRWNDGEVAFNFSWFFSSSFNFLSFFSFKPKIKNQNRKHKWYVMQMICIPKQYIEVGRRRWCWWRKKNCTNKQTNENTQCAKIFIYDSITTHTRTHHIIYIFIYVRMHGKQLIRIRTELQKFTHHSTIVHTTYSNEWNKFGWKSTTKPVILNIRTIIHDGRKQTKVCACSLTLGLLRFRRRCCCCCFFTVWFFFRVRFVFVAVAAATAAHVLSHTLCIDSVYAYDRILWRQSLPIRFAATLSWRIRYSFGSMCVRVHM